MTFSRLLQMALPAIAVLGLATAPSRGQAVSSNGELLMGFRASGGAGSTKNYMVDLGSVSAFLTATTVQHISLSGVGADLSSASFYGATWHDRTDLFWGVVGANGNFAAIGSETPGTLYASRAEGTNGVLEAPWERHFGGSQSTSTTKVDSARSGFNFGAQAANAAALARTMSNTDANSWSSFQPGGFNAASFQTWSPTIEGSPSQYLDLFKIAPLNSGDSPAPGIFLGRLVLEATGDLTFIPTAALGVNTVQFASATYSAAENVVGGKIVVTLTRSGDTSTATSVTVSTADGTAIAGTDYTALTSQPVTFAAGETIKNVSIDIANLPQDQGTRSFTVSVGGSTGGTSIGAQGSTTASITEAPSLVALSAGSYTADQVDTSVDVTITRTGGSTATSVKINTADGTAVAGTDYTALSGVVVNIPANTSSVIQTITLSHPAGQQPDKDFTVTLEEIPASGATVDVDNAAATVTILATDSVAPVVAITKIGGLTTTNPVINGTTGGSVTVEGTASDNGTLSTVEVSVDGGVTWVAAIVTGGTWTASVHPAGGPTTVIAKATDSRSNSTTATRGFTYKVVVALQVIIDGPGAGTFSGLLNGAVYEVGKTYTLTAKASAGSVFDSWSGGGLAAPANELPKLSFVFSGALAATPIIHVKFVLDPFAAANKVTGAYSGIVKAHTGTTASNSTNGLLSLTLTAKGTFTGTLKIDGLSLSTNGLFDNQGVAKFGATRSTKLSVPRTNKAPYELTANLDFANKRVTGTLKEFFRTTLVAQSDVVANLVAPTVPAGLLNQGIKGFYTVVLPARTANVSLAGATLTAADYPQGDGVGTISLSNKGVVTFAGTLADGTSVSSTGALDKNNESYIFAQLYAGKAGSVGGSIKFEDLANTDVSGADLFWFRPWQNVQWYPWGWPEGLLTDIAGAKYASVAGTSVVPLLPAVTAPTGAGNATLTFSDGLLSGNVEKSMNIAAKNTVTNLIVPSTNKADATFKLTITASSGALAGSFTHTDGTKPAFKGVVLQKGANKAGFGYFLTVAPKPINGMGESGGVSLLHK